MCAPVKGPKIVMAPVVMSLVVLCAGLVGSCSSSPAKPSDPVLARGQEVYMANCASCHGSTGNGGAGPKLKGVVASRYTLDAQMKIIADGRRGTAMAPFKDKLSPEEIEAVARYERESL